jgi:hypothetical protein
MILAFIHMIFDIRVKNICIEIMENLVYHCNENLFIFVNINHESRNYITNRNNPFHKYEHKSGIIRMQEVLGVLFH